MAACDGGGCVSDACREAVRLMNCGDFAASLSLATAHASQRGDGDAAAVVGLHHYYGYGTKMSDAKRDEWLRRGAEMGSGMAKAFEAYHAAEGPTGALLRPYADSGLSVAQSALGRCFEHGWGVTQDNAEALRLFLKAADQGLPAAIYNAGVFFDEGLGTEKDLAKAADCYRRAAAHGHVQAQYNYSLCLEEGEGTPKDPVEALRYLTLAAEQMYPSALLNLAAAHERGTFGAAVDHSASMRYYLLAVDTGEPDALYYLGIKHLEGRGIPKDKAEAVRCFLEASRKGHDDSKHLLYRLVARAVQRDSSAAVERYVGLWGVPVTLTEFEGMTLLHCASHFRNGGKAAQTLIELGADVNAQTDIERDTPLHIASRVGNAKVIMALLEGGADRDLKNQEGQTSEDVAVSEDIKEMIRNYIELPIIKGTEV